MQKGDEKVQTKGEMLMQLFEARRYDLASAADRRLMAGVLNEAFYAAEQVRASEGGEMHVINRWMETKGYSAAGLNSIIQLLNEIDYQARECGAVAEKARTSVRASEGGNDMAGRDAEPQPIVLSDPDWVAFAEALDMAPKPSERLRELLRSNAPWELRKTSSGND